ncbi:uracil-DNA glycosylase [Ectothiorhodospira sp. 9100]|uniref:uracil-DNA glycosylase n=1 Tax=unclassified Ectothiorhodospira TaxID=2684909 RepID=UPI001EE79B78|nr:uracil-DNA glycosylase [Ectothiorhodospira sp. 9100]MCG5519081.1 uracil-DNA glycosylase [Ectothiorhodospira sp. 9905]
MVSRTVFDPHCVRCPRLAGFLSQVRQAHPEYHAAPVPPFGDPDARLLIVGLAPGMHGANASGRPFTGDHAGILLYRTLYETGFGSQPESCSRDDGLILRDCRITNAVKCLPPQNKPQGAEVRACNDYLAAEMETLPAPAVVLALGSIAHQAILRARGLKLKDHPFGHGCIHDLPGGITLVDSYHCSRYNTQTRRLTPEMFQAVFAELRQRLDAC